MRVSMHSYLAEFIGTFFFLLCILASGGSALIIGGALAFVIYMIASLSGGHVNPAVSFAMYMKGGLKPMELMYYVVSQLLGAAAAVHVFAML